MWYRVESVEELEVPDREKLNVLVPEVVGVGREKLGINDAWPVGGGPVPPTMLPPPVKAVGGNPNDSCLEVTPGG